VYRAQCYKGLVVELHTTKHRVVVLIPTFRRIVLLTELLHGLIPQAREAGALIIVGDNACEASVAQLIGDRSADAAIAYLEVPARGVSQVRNALIAEAIKLAPDWQWILMLDDDGQVTPGWLNTVLQCAQSHNPDLLGGPVIGILPPNAGRLARNSVFAERTRWPTGPVKMLNTTQNLVINRALLDRLPLPLFKNHLGASGGEDYDLFRRVAQAKGSLVWCDEAVILEPAPAERLTTPALLHRYYSTGIYMAPIDAGYDGWPSGIELMLKGLTASTISCLLQSLTGRFDRAARSLLMSAHYAGRFAGLLGMRSARYVKKEKKTS